jgi:hypothetical protein
VESLEADGQHSVRTVAEFEDGADAGAPGVRRPVQLNLVTERPGQGVVLFDTPKDKSKGFLPSQGRFRRSLRDTNGNLIPLVVGAIPTSTGVHGRLGARP